MPHVSGSARWGWRRSWSKGPLINAQIEGAAEAPTFRTAWRHGRSIVPIDGFYEWRRQAGQRQPHYFHRPQGRLWLAALLGSEEDQAVATVLTMAPHDIVAPVHDRMPVMLSEAGVVGWLQGDEQPEIILNDELACHPVDAGWVQRNRMIGACAIRCNSANKRRCFSSCEAD